MVIEPISIEPVAAINPLLERFDAVEHYEQGTSTIAKAQGSERYAPSKPELDPPSPIWNSINLIGRLESAANSYSLSREKQIDCELDRIQQLHREESVQLEAALEASKEVTFWGILEDMTNTFMSGISFYFGFAALSTGAPLAGGVLITSGFLSLTNLAFKHGEIWDWAAETASCGNEELHHGIKTYAPAAIGIAAAAASMFGIYSAWSLPAATGMQSSLSVLQTTTSLSTGLTAMTSGKSQANFKWTSGALSALQSKAELSRMDLGLLIEETKDFHQSQEEILQLAGRLIREADQAVQVTQQPV